METYKEYPIRCKTCNEQIACFSADYEILLDSGYTFEAALDELGITEYCSRIAMMTPTIVAFNMENREVIEGFKNVEAADEETDQNESISQPIFSQCRAIQPTDVQMGPILTIPSPIRTIPNAPGVITQPMTFEIGLTTPKPQPIGLSRPVPPGMQVIGLSQPTVRPPVQLQPTPTIQPITAPKQNIVAPIIPGIELGIEIEPLGERIQVKEPEPNEIKKFHEPTMVGVPTINSDPLLPQVTIYVGAGKYTRILNGRTYLAQ